MLCECCRGIRLDDLCQFDTVEDDKVEKCQLTGLTEAYKHQPSFFFLNLSGRKGCELCFLISQVLVQKHDDSSGQILNNDDIIYRSINNEPESDLLLQLETDNSSQIYLYRIDGSERQEDPGIFEIAVVPTFVYASSRPSESDEQYDGKPDAFFWRALEVWPQNDKSAGLVCQQEEAFGYDSPKTSSCEFGGYAHRRHITSDPSSIVAMNIAKYWLESCETSHADCVMGTQYPMPTRVIDVGPSDGSEMPRICHSEGKAGEWATLSHCWGRTVTTTLTLATLQDQEQGISIGTLPKNFQDAISITRMLGVRYLWIDSLCIIQDSDEDWLKESAEMGEIYKKSFITIAATNAENSAIEFLRDRIAEVDCSLELSTGIEIQVWIRPRIEWYCFAEIGGPLAKRAWVLQERLLARRILYFGKQQIMWQCNSKTLAEGFCDTDKPREGQVPEDVEDVLRKQFHAGIIDSPARSLGTRAESYNMRDNIYDQWYHVIGKYGTLNLTKQSDKLPAIAGIARQVQLATGDTYLAGLWKSDIERGLQWYYQPPEILTDPPTPRAPSWSWAAHDIKPDRAAEYLAGSVNLNISSTSHYSPYEHRVKLISYSPNFSSNTCLSNPPLGSITLLGLCIPATFVPAPTTTLPDLDPDPDAQRFALSFPIPLLLANHSFSHVAARLDRPRSETNPEGITILQLGKFECSGRYPCADYVSALLLAKVPGRGRAGGGGEGGGQNESESERFVRIGHAVFYKRCELRKGWVERRVVLV